MFSVSPPQIFQVQAEILATRPALPDYLSTSCDYKEIAFFHTVCQKKDILTNFTETRPLGNLSIKNVSFVTFAQIVELTKCFLFSILSLKGIVDRKKIS